MREDKHRRKYRQHVASTASDLISKEVNKYDTCDVFNVYYMSLPHWKERHEDSEAVFRPDPFGINDYFVEYSLNKKKRWTLAEEIADRIEEVQDPRLNLRFSASVHGMDRSNSEAFFDRYYDYTLSDKMPCLEYHSVSRDGKTVVHKKSENGRSRLRNFTHKAQPPRRAKGEKAKKGTFPRRYPYIEAYDWSDRFLEPVEKDEHQKLHIQYTIQRHTDKPSLHNKMTSKKTRRDPTERRIDFFDSSERSESMKRRVMGIKPKYGIVIEEELALEDDVITPIIDESYPVPTVVEDLSELVVRKLKRRKIKRENPRRFVDELLKTSIFTPSPGTSGYGSGEETEDEEEVPSSSIVSTTSIPVVVLPSEMFTRLSVSSLPNLLSTPRLPCYPPAWEVDQKDSIDLLGKDLLTSVIARQYGEELRLAIVEDFTPIYFTRPSLPPTEEIPPDIVYDNVQFCDICCGEMDPQDEDRYCHPFSLSCGHIFCSGCWLSHISMSIHRQKLPATCLHPDCSTSVSVSATKGLLSASSVDIYEEATIKALKAADTLISCPDCGRVHYTTKSLHVSCPCGAFLCAHCASIDHSPLGCDVFEQYNAYMKRSGFASLYSTSSEAPIIRDLAKCPKCNALMQRSEGCNHMACYCGMEFCFMCSAKWTTSHYECTKQIHSKTTMVDVSTARSSPLLVPSLLILAVEARTILLDRRIELKKRLTPLPLKERKMAERTFVELSLIVELCCLSFRRSRQARIVADRVRFWLDEFFNTGDKDMPAKARKLKALRDSLPV
ncbi:hypothetical protein PMAYCL1PPCAC_01073 [Pristionchus mayeri]|uniref:RBR-type E3 ubiquitin transferase n=1 Tax=Pristionchus mayeri TaxID=1317129 RepID=A0AAN4YYQ3_9BILA|nr:hypothetical protein PMAYCL1PPCAC_01073 [Pristionchus mayeri]